MAEKPDPTKKFKQYHENFDMYTKNAQMANTLAVADFFKNAIKSDIRNLDTIKRADVEKGLMNAYTTNHGAILNKEFGYDHKSMDKLPDHLKKSAFKALYHVDVDEESQKIMKKGSDYDFHAQIAKNNEKKIEHQIVSTGAEFSKLEETVQKELIKKHIIPGLKSGHEFNYSLLKTQPEAIGQSIAQAYKGVSATNLAEQLSFRKTVKDEYKR